MKIKLSCDIQKNLNLVKCQHVKHMEWLKTTCKCELCNYSYGSSYVFPLSGCNTDQDKEVAMNEIMNETKKKSVPWNKLKSLSQWLFQCQYPLLSSTKNPFSWMIAQTINRRSRTLVVGAETIYVGYTEAHVWKSLTDKLHIDWMFRTKWKIGSCRTKTLHKINY